MTQSMTAFARSEQTTPCGILSCEIKTLNHRYLDVVTRTPQPLRALEAEIVKQIRSKLSRGRVECCFNLQRPDGNGQAKVNTENLLALAGEIRKVEAELHHLGIQLTPVSALDVMSHFGITAVPEPDPEQLQQDTQALLDETLNGLVKTRLDEGGRLREFILKQGDKLEQNIAYLRNHHPKSLAAARAKLNSRLAEMDVGADAERLAQEAALLAQKLYIGADIEEELDRCDSHILELKAIFKRNEPIGRRLDFQMQELNREANTISSKSIDTETTHTAVEIKTIVEQMREQVQNIE